jgi:D-cysteine desulfhydrase
VPERPLFARWPALAERFPWVALGNLPTPLEPLSALAPDAPNAARCWVKRDDRTAVEYGGNKVRTLELLFGHALAQGARRIYATGAYGSNHAVATVLHAPRVGLEAGVVLYPQPRSQTARDNLRLSAALASDRVALPHWSCLPAALCLEHCRRAFGPLRCAFMPPGGAIPRGALGYVSAAFELAEQLQALGVAVPDEIVLGLGSTCTTAGLLVGLCVAGRLGLWGTAPVPRLIAVRVTPWPVTSRWRVLGFAEHVAELLLRATGSACFRVPRWELGSRLVVDGSELGPGYGWPSASGAAAMAALRPFSAQALDSTYSAKAAAGLVRRLCEAPDLRRVFWATKSSAPLPPVSEENLERAPRAWRRFLERPSEGDDL